MVERWNVPLKWSLFRGHSFIFEGGTKHLSTKFSSKCQRVSNFSVCSCVKDSGSRLGQQHQLSKLSPSTQKDWAFLVHKSKKKNVRQQHHPVRTKPPQTGASGQLQLKDPESSHVLMKHPFLKTHLLILILAKENTLPNCLRVPKGISSSRV